MSIYGNGVTTDKVAVVVLKHELERLRGDGAWDYLSPRSRLEKLERDREFIEEQVSEAKKDLEDREMYAKAIERAIQKLEEGEAKG